MNIKWTYEKVLKIAKGCKTRMELKYKCKPAYEAAHRHKWMDSFDWFCDGTKLFAESRRKWNHDTTIEESKKYSSRAEFAKGSPAAYAAARKNKWLDECTWFKTFTLPRNYWNYENCYNEAMKYTNRSDMMMLSGSAYNSALKNNWLDDYTWLDSGYVKRGYWTYDICYEAAKQFNIKKILSVIIIKHMMPHSEMDG